MFFKMTFDDFKEVSEYVLRKSNKSYIKLNILPGENEIQIEFYDKMEDKCVISIYTARNDNQSNLYPVVSKTMRLNDDKG